MEYLKKIDRQLLKWAYQKYFKDIFFIKALIFMGDGPFWMIVVFISALTGQLYNSVSFTQLSILLMFGLAISNLVFTPLKSHIKRIRPYANAELHRDLQIEITNRDPGHGSKELESFPSGHVLWTTLCVSIICFKFGFIAILIFGWLIPAMMFLRPYLGVHYPSDVLAGLILGSINTSITLVISHTLMDFINSLKEYNGYIYGYWFFISVFLFVGFKSWLKRV
ncbi:MAG: phosphatase PAP2 family protein [Desulfobacterales bacterium]|nr:phosphatase PAP2 family protein [Desulfobacterales bacterium]MCP4161984.1 phosphatase PAP2 family protein [Deltaproteobacteria bacterium]